MTSDLYVQAVIDHVPSGLPLREQIAMEMRSHITERVAHGQALEAVLQQLGDPLTLAESYLAEIPLRSAPIMSRVAAKAIDVAAVILVALAAAAALWAVLPVETTLVLPLLFLLGAVFGFVAYTVIAEYVSGRTLGKRLMGIRVVRESGARISLGQSALRQLPFLGQFFFIDALFALFTQRRQRAFEILTKTRAVAVLLCVGLWLRP